MIIIGHGGHARSVVDTIERAGEYRIAGYVTNDEELNGSEVIGCDNDLPVLFNKYKYAAVGVGYLKISDLRKNLYLKMKEMGYEFPIIIDPSAIVSDNVKIGEGTFIGKGAIINTGSVIGKLSIINTAAVIEHDCTIGDYSHISIGAIVCGGVETGEGSLIGANATLTQYIKLGKGSFVKAGSLVKSNYNVE